MLRISVIEQCHCHGVECLLQEPCGEYAVITEPTNGLRVVVCGGVAAGSSQSRERHIYTSRSNLVHIKMTAWPQDIVPPLSQQQQQLPASVSGWTDDFFDPIMTLPARYVMKFEGLLVILFSACVCVCI